MSIQTMCNTGNEHTLAYAHKLLHMQSYACVDLTMAARVCVCPCAGWQINIAEQHKHDYACMRWCRPVCVQSDPRLRNRHRHMVAWSLSLFVFGSLFPLAFPFTVWRACTGDFQLSWPGTRNKHSVSHPALCHVACIVSLMPHAAERLTADNAWFDFSWHLNGAKLWACGETNEVCLKPSSPWQETQTDLQRCQEFFSDAKQLEEVLSQLAKVAQCSSSSNISDMCRRASSQQGWDCRITVSEIKNRRNSSEGGKTQVIVIFAAGSSPHAVVETHETSSWAKAVMIAMQTLVIFANVCEGVYMSSDTLYACTSAYKVCIYIYII